MDVLSEVLTSVKLNGALFYNGEFSEPWCFRQPASQDRASCLSTDSQHVIVYHLLTEGRGYAQIEGVTGRFPLTRETSSSFRTAIRTLWEPERPSRRSTVCKS